MKDDSFVTICLTSECKDEHFKNLSIYLEENFFDYEILLIGSRSNGTNGNRLDNIFREIPCVRYLEYFGEFDNFIFQKIALKNSIGDYLVFFNPEFDPYEAIGNIVKVAKKSDVCIGFTAKNKSFIVYTIGRLIVMKCFKKMRQLQSGTTELICLSRSGINILLRLGFPSRRIVLDILNSGLLISYYEYKLLQSREYSRSFIKGFSEVINFFIFASIKPLRIVSVLGFVTSFISFLTICCSVLVKFFLKSVIPGWASSIVIISFFFMIIFLILAFLSEYIGRILSEVEYKSDYSVFSEKTSKVMINKDRLNVLSE